ncbi:MAG: hypothetical protein ACJAYC_003848 [Halieaceae bacterium]|jgi:hypothetical protein
MSFPKEPGYLAFGETGYTFPDGYGRLAPASKYVVNNYADYLGLFSDATPQQHVLGDASTWYLAKPGMARKIIQYNPEGRIIVVFRNPVERAYSAWCHARSDDIEPCEDFAAAMALEPERGESEYLLRYRRMGLYSEDLKHYQAAFPANQILLMFYDDMRADPAAFWREVCTFLQISAEIEPPFERRYNRSGAPRSRALQSILRNYKLKKVLRAIIPYQLGLQIKERLDNFNLRDLPTLDERTRGELQNYYRGDIEELSRLTGRNLEAWLK